MTAFFIDCPAKNVMTAIELLADSMQHVTLRAARVRPRAEGRAARTGRRRGRSAAACWASCSTDTVYAVHPARHPVIGYLEVLNRTTNQAIIDFYHERYVPNNQVFVVVGDVKTQDVLDQVAQAVDGHAAAAARPYVALPDEPEQLSPREAVREMDGATYDFALAWPTVKLSRPGHVRPGPGGLHPRRGRKLAAGAAVEVRQAAGPVGRRRQRHAALRPRLFRRLRQLPAGDAGSRPREEILREVYRLRDELVGAGRAGQGQEAEGGRAGLRPPDRAAGGREPGPRASSPPAIRCSTRPMWRGSRRSPPSEIRDAARRYFVPQRLNRVIIAPPGGAPKAGRRGRGGRARRASAWMRLPNGLRVLVKRHAEPAPGQHPGLRAGRLARGQREDRRPRRPAGRHARQGHRRATRPRRSPITSTPSAASFPSAPAASRFFGEAPRRCARTFPRRPPLLAECFTQPAFPDRTNLPRRRSWPWAKSPTASADPQAEIAEFFADQPARRVALSPGRRGQGGIGQAADGGRPERLPRQVFRARTTWSSPFSATLSRTQPRPWSEKLFGELQPGAQPRPIDFHRPNALPHVGRLITSERTRTSAMVMLGYPCESIFEQEGPRRHDRADGDHVGLRLPGRVAAQRAARRGAWSTSCRPSR